MNNDQISKLEKVAQRLEAAKIAEYIELSQKPWRLFWLGFLYGMARGLGFTIGTAIILAFIYKVLKELIALNIPYLTDVFTHWISFIKDVN